MAIDERLMRGAWLQADDTGYPVQDGLDGKLRKGRLWAVTDQQEVRYHFTDTKEGHNPANCHPRRRRHGGGSRVGAARSLHWGPCGASAADAEVDALLSPEGLHEKIADGLERAPRELGKR